MQTADVGRSLERQQRLVSCGVAWRGVAAWWQRNPALQSPSCHVVVACRGVAWRGVVEQRSRALQSRSCHVVDVVCSTIDVERMLTYYSAVIDRYTVGDEPWLTRRAASASSQSTCCTTSLAAVVLPLLTAR